MWTDSQDYTIVASLAATYGQDFPTGQPVSCESTQHNARGWSIRNILVTFEGQRRWLATIVNELGLHMCYELSPQVSRDIAVRIADLSVPCRELEVTRKGDIGRKWVTR